MNTVYVFIKPDQFLDLSASCFLPIQKLFSCKMATFCHSQIPQLTESLLRNSFRFCVLNKLPHFPTLLLNIVSLVYKQVNKSI